MLWHFEGSIAGGTGGHAPSSSGRVSRQSQARARAASCASSNFAAVNKGATVAQHSAWKASIHCISSSSNREGSVKDREKGKGVRYSNLSQALVPYAYFVSATTATKSDSMRNPNEPSW